MDSAAQRKERNECYLRQLGVPVNTVLPAWCEPVLLQPAADVAGRAIVSLHVMAAGHGDPRDRIAAYLQREELWYLLNAAERTLLEDSAPAPAQLIDAQWELESVKVLLWALGFVRELGLPNELCSLTSLVAILPGPGEPTRAFRAGTQLRAATVILDALDLVYRMHWVTRNAILHQSPNPLGFREDVVAKWHSALSWVVSAGCAWDDVDVST